MQIVGTSLLGHWTVEPLAAAGLIASALLYASGVHRLALRGRHWSLKRTIPFVFGLIAITIATQSPLAAQDTKLFSAHVVQHLLLAMVAPALLCLGAPITLALQACERPTQVRILSVLHSRIIKFLTFPVVSWGIFVGTLFILYFSPLYEYSLRNPLVHELIHVHFILAGSLFFSAVVAIDPHPWRMPHGLRLLNVALTLPAHAFLALALLSANTPLAVSFYLANTSHDVGQLLRDQKVGAAIMWIAGDLIAIATVGIVAVQWASSDDKASEREDRIVDLQRADAAQLSSSGPASSSSGLTGGSRPT